MNQDRTEEVMEGARLQQDDQFSTTPSTAASKSYREGPKCTKGCSVLKFIWNILTSHLGLFIVLLLYTLGGAWTMLALEGTEQKPFVPGIINRTGVVPAENFTQYFVTRTIRRRTDLWTDKDKEDNDSGYLNKNKRIFINSSIQLMMNAAELRDILNSYFKDRNENARTDDIQDRTFWEWMLFCLSIYTTIGYGSVFPVTNYGRVATMVYATIGVPLFLITMAKMGKLLTRAVKLVWSYIHKCLYLKPVRKVRKNLLVKCHGKDNASTTTTTKQHSNVGDTNEDTSNETMEDATSYVSYKIDDEFNLNPLVAILITLVYILLGSWMYAQWEDDWGFYDAFYFIFISVTTIGLGDLVPKHPIFFLLSSLYILVGLALVAMVIHVLTEFFTSTIHIVENRIHIRHGYKDSTIPTLLNDAQIQQISDEIPQIRIHVQDPLSVVRNEVDVVSIIQAQETVTAVKNETDVVGVAV